MEIQEVVDAVNGKLVGNDEFFSIDGFTGNFTFLNDSHTVSFLVSNLNILITPF